MLNFDFVFVGLLHFLLQGKHSVFQIVVLLGKEIQFPCLDFYCVLRMVCSGHTSISVSLRVSLAFCDEIAFFVYC